MDIKVSFDDEPLILVDQKNVEIGTLEKEACHLGEGKLHRAFSIFLLNSSGQVFIQKRSAQKMLWPGFWSNSCCSHPRRGETTVGAAHRRLEEELGIQTELEELYDFEYKASYLDLGSEHERCSVLLGFSDDPVLINENEISDWRWLLPTEVDELIKNQNELTTPWFEMEWSALRSKFPEKLTVSRSKE